MTEPILDDVNKQIIEQLQRDGRMSYAALAKVVGLSEAAVRQRVQRLLDNGVMQIVAVTDPLTLGFARQVMVGLKVGGRHALGGAARSPQIPEVDYVVICAGAYDLLAETGLHRRRPPAHPAQRPDPRRSPASRGPRPSSISSSPSRPTHGEPDEQRPSSLDAAARDHLWMHFTRLSAYADAPVPMIVRGEGPYVCDVDGKRYLDGLSGLFVVQAGHGRHELADAAAKQAAELAYFPLWSYAHPKAVELAERLADADPRRPQPGLLHHRRLRGGRVGLEAGPLLLQADRQAGQAQGDLPAHRLPRHLDGRAVDHRPARPSRPTSSRWCPPASGCPTPTSTGPGRHAGPAAPRRGVRAVGRRPDRARRSSSRVPDTVAAVFLEPVQNSGGCFPPPARLLPAGPRDLRRSTTCCSSPTR